MYAKKYSVCLDNPSLITSLTVSNFVRNNIVKALSAYARFTGCYEQFRAKLRSCGIHYHKQSAIEAFLRIMKASESDILDWYAKAHDVARDNEKLLLEFLKDSGVRYEEAINSFNLIVQLKHEGALSQYYNKELSCLLHFRYPKLFLRNSKNVYISFVSENLINRIANSSPITYYIIRRRLTHCHLKTRISELRDWYGTFLLSHSILQQEVDLLQGRLPVEIFIRHYWSPRLKELGNRVFKALEKSEHMEESKQAIINSP
jgi:intergrase/recombinase